MKMKTTPRKTGMNWTMTGTMKTMTGMTWTMKTMTRTLILTCGVCPELTLLASFSLFLVLPTGREWTESWSSVSEASEGGTGEAALAWWTLVHQCSITLIQDIVITIIYLGQYRH